MGFESTPNGSVMTVSFLDNSHIQNSILKLLENLNQ